MAIIQTIDNASQFRDQFRQCGRGDQFTYEALGLLFDYLNDCGEEIELDVIAICCDYTVDTWQDIASYYSIRGFDACEDEDSQIAAVRSYLEDNTTIVGETSSGAFVYVQF
jgi:hypothetical protein